jgi:alkaline phosphatase D
VASELVGTSITSQARSQERVDSFKADNPHMKYSDSRYRGYVRCELTPKRCLADLRAMDTVQTRDSACNTLASFVVEDGIPGPKKA